MWLLGVINRCCLHSASRFNDSCSTPWEQWDHWQVHGTDRWDIIKSAENRNAGRNISGKRSLSIIYTGMSSTHV